MEHIFRYGETETGHLLRCDAVLAGVIRRIGPIRRATVPDLFEALCGSIISQQISNKAAATVGRRFRALLGDVTPERVAAMDPLQIQGCGMSLRKAGYIRSAAEAVLDGRLDTAALPSMDDAEVIGRLTALPGIGVWTAEMLMIFSLQRPDVLSYDDLIIRRSLMTLYGLDALTREQFAEYRRRYSPYGSVASLYLWAMAMEPGTEPSILTK